MTEIVICPRCKTKRILNDFYNHKNILMKSCKYCREYGKKWRERNKDKLKKQYEKNKCIHGTEKYVCKICDGSQICIHNRIRCRCRECGGSGICEHNRIRSQCKVCMNIQQKIEYIQKKMISGSRCADKKYNRYDADHFIDKCFLEGLFEDSQNCYYCDIQFTYNEKCSTLVTIERIDNSIGHIKSNCVLSCYACNVKRNYS